MDINVYKQKKWLNYITIELIKNVVLAIVFTIVFAYGILGYRHMIVETWSMTPTIQKDALIIVNKIDYNDYKVGDIVTHKLGTTDKNNTHRMVARLTTTNQIVTANEQYYLEHKDSGKFGNIDSLSVLPSGHDTPLIESRIVGKVVYYNNWMGNIFIFFQNTFNAIITIAGLVLFLFILNFM